jgi:peroxiredoxin
MGRLKPLFLTSFVALTFVLGALAALNFARDKAQIAWLGVLLSAISVLAYFLNLYRFRTPRTSPNLLPVSFAVVAGAAISDIDIRQGGPTPFVSGLVILIGWLGYAFWYSRLERGSSTALAPGSRFPDFELHDEHGKVVSSRVFLGSPAIYLFYRGNWCPICIAQIRELSESYRELTARGAQVVLISPQPQRKTRNLAKRFKVPFQFLVDEGNQLAERLGIAHDRGIPEGYQLLGYKSATVFPTVVITDSTGDIVFAHQTDNYRVRPHPEEFIRILDERLAASTHESQG